MKLAIITESPEQVASTYWRALQHVSRLERRGAEVDLFVPTVVQRRLAGGVGKALVRAEHVLQYVRRGHALRTRVKRYDSILIQRGAYPMGPAWITRALERFPGRVVFDLDDDVFSTAPIYADTGRVTRWLRGPQQAEYLLRRADVVVVSTPELADALPGRRADMIVPTVPDVERFPTVIHSPREALRVGWTGNPGNLMYLDPLRDVFARLLGDGTARLEVLCSEPWDGPATFRRWRRDEEAEALAGYDVGIMPLPETPYTQAKAGFKLLMHMGVGSAVIASPVGGNRDLVERSGAGILATSAKDWEAGLRRLAGDVGLRKKMGDAGHRFIISYADLEAQADALFEALSGGPRRAG